MHCRMCPSTSVRVNIVAFLGPSGSGKSTLFRLLLGFERPTTGSVLLDGHDLLSLDCAAIRRHFGVVLQNGQISPGTLTEIIAGEAQMTEGEVWEVVRAVGLDEDIEAMPLGLSTVVPEGGAGLSGGQRQRLLVARALARKPRVLLFDEATSMLDNRTQDDDPDHATWLVHHPCTDRPPPQHGARR